MTILKDTSLCSIVRDEMMNPAGGIERFIRSIVPHVESAVILDTGSIDGTREKLEELSREYPQMQVYDRKFDNYVNSRNASLKKVKTKLTLVLDADELITRKGFEELETEITQANPNIIGFNFLMNSIFPDSKDVPDYTLHNPRLFQIHPDFRYSTYLGSTSEYLFNMKFKRLEENLELCEKLPSHILIHHFLPLFKGRCLKTDSWYHPNKSEKKVYIENFWQTSPSKVEGFKSWKKYNPKRDLYV